MALVSVVAVLAVFAGFTYELFWSPSTQRPQHVDALVVLGGEAEVSYFPVHLALEGWAPTVAYSTPTAGQTCPHSTATISVICFRPDPKSTQGEARAVGALARTHHWGSLMVVSGYTQTTRARIRIERCFSGRVLMVPIPPPSGFFQRLHDVAYEWGATLKAVLWQRSC